MKTLLGLFLALLLPLLAACAEGDSEPDVTAPDASATPSGGSSASEEEEEDGSGEDPTDGTSDAVEVVAILDESNAKDSLRGSDSGLVVVLDTPLAIDEFAGRFSGNTLPAAIREAAGEASPDAGQVLVGAPVSLGCDVPTEVAVEGSGTDLSLSAVDMGKQDSVQCLVPVLTVALVLVDESRVA